jgi:hypothetical protein
VSAVLAIGIVIAVVCWADGKWSEGRHSYQIPPIKITAKGGTSFQGEYSLRDCNVEGCDPKIAAAIMSEVFGIAASNDRKMIAGSDATQPDHWKIYVAGDAPFNYLHISSSGAVYFVQNPRMNIDEAKLNEFAKKLKWAH